MKLPSIKRLGPTKGSQLELKHGLGRSAISSAVANPAALFEHLCPPAFVDVTREDLAAGLPFFQDECITLHTQSRHPGPT